MKKQVLVLKGKIASIALILFSFYSINVQAQIPAGYYDPAIGLSGTSLKAALNGIISGHTTYPYSSSSTDVWDILKVADRDPNNAANVIGLYSGFSMDAAAEYAGGAGWNREHVWAKSRGDFGTAQGAGTDVHHLRAADISTNSARNNRNFDYGTTFYIDGSGNYLGPTLSKTSTTDWVWEPRDEMKGDVARMIFYMATRYEGFNGDPDLELTETYLTNTDKSPVHARLSTLLAWHQADPVSAAEQTRNDVVYSYQNNRNPYIDHPEYVCLIYACTGGGNNPPSFTSTAITSATVDATYAYNITTTDADAGDVLTISATTIPAWLSLTDNGNGTASLSGTPAAASTDNVTLAVSDGTTSVNQSFTITVTTAGTGVATDLIISEYIEGSSYNKGIEIANFTGASVNLANYSLQKQTNGAGSWGSQLTLSGTILNGDVFVVAHSSADAAMQAQADLVTNASFMTFNGNDAVGLFKTGALLDMLGVFNNAANYGKDVTLVRKATVSTASATYVVTEWDSHPSNTFTYLGSHQLNGGGTTDTTAPSVPIGLAASNVTQTSLTLSWSSSTDNVGVTGYDLYQGAILFSTVSGTSANVTGLTASSTYSYTVRAKDLAGNVSAASTALSVTTLAAVDATAPSVPTGLAASNVTQTSLTLSWSSSTDNVGVTGYDVYQGATLFSTVTGTSANVTGLTASSTYSYTVRAKDLAGNVSAASAALAVTTSASTVTYCTSSGNSVAYEHIDLVQIGTINNTSAANGGYGDFTSLSTNLSVGGSNTITFSAGFSGATYNENWSVWIDYNQNGDFNDAGEQVVTGSTTNGANSSASFVVPVGTSLGSTRMRVTMVWNTAPANCGTFSYGEVEDYTVNITSDAVARIPTLAITGNELNREYIIGLASVYPNPVVDVFTINMENALSVKAVDMSGKSIYLKLEADTRTINVSHIPSGVYILNVSTERGVFTSRFTKK